MPEMPDWQTLTVRFLIIRMTTTLLRYPDIVEVQINLADIEIINAGITDRSQDTSQIRVRGKECGFYQRRVADSVSNLAALFFITPLLYVQRDEFGRAFTIAHNQLRQFLR